MAFASADTLFARGDWVTAERLYAEEAEAAYGVDGRELDLARAVFGLGNCSEGAGVYGVALERWTEALHLYRTYGPPGHPVVARLDGLRRAYERSPVWFLSYAWADRPHVVAIEAALVVRGARVLRDERDMLGGELVEHEIRRLIAMSTAMMCFWSRAFATGAYTRFELDSGYEAHRRVLLCTLDDTPVPAKYARLLRIDASGMTPQVVADRVVGSEPGAEAQTPWDR